MFQRTDTLPEMRALVNTDHVVAVLPISGGIKSKIYLVTGEAWEISLPFSRASGVLRGETEMIAPTNAADRRPGAAGPSAAPTNPIDRRSNPLIAR
jgi:hypothetical protein